MSLQSLPIKYQLPTCYSFWNLARTRFYRSRSLQQGQRSNQGHTMRCTPTTPNRSPYKVSTSYMLQFQRYSPHMILKVKVTTARSKVKSRSHHDVAYLYPLTNVPTKYQLPTSCHFRDIAQTNFFPLAARLPAHPDTMGENNTLTALKNCGVKTDSI